MNNTKNALFEPHFHYGEKYYSAKDVDKMLAEGEVARSYGSQTIWRSVFADQQYIANDGLYLEDEETHEALLINIEPIKKQSREEKLEEFIKDVCAGNYLYNASNLKARAKALLGE
jgi:hypothetical protein